MTHIWMGDVMHMDGSYHAYYGWIISHAVNESSHTHEWIMSHILMRHATLVNESFHEYEWVISHVWMSHVTHMNESCHAYKRVISCIWVSHVTRTNKSCDPYVHQIYYTISDEVNKQHQTNGTYFTSQPSAAESNRKISPRHGDPGPCVSTQPPRARGSVAPVLLPRLSMIHNKITKAVVAKYD